MTNPTDKPKRKSRRVVPAVGPRLKKLLAVVFGLFALLVVNSVYLLSVTLAGVKYQGWFYMIMFLAHLILGLAIVLPTIAFGIGHIRNTHNRRNRRAVRVGYALFVAAILLFFSGLVLTRVDLPGFRFEINHPTARQVAYWAHVLCPVAAVWLFILHRLSGRKIAWRVGLTWAGVAAVFAAGMLILQMQDPRSWNAEGPESSEKYFFPSLARTSNGDFIPAEVLDNDAYCADCHATVHERWKQSAHKFSSFNNPVYEFSVKATRAQLNQRDGNTHASRFCAGCHDPVPFFSGAFDDPKFDDPNYDLKSDAMAQAGITCTTCHAISHINSPKGNSDFTIDEPLHYPFAFTENGMLKWVNHQLIKAKPAFHKATFLKPLHKSPEFCGSCHKVHLPKELNDYKWLRGQNHYDSFLLSGVSGHGVSSFYYPPKAEANCNDCHMPAVAVNNQPNFGSSKRDDNGRIKTMDHLFPSANTALPALLPDQFADPVATIAEHQRFNEGVMRLDLFGIKHEGRLDGELVAPLRPQIPALKPGETYLLETVIRTLKMGHLFTQGTVDSNQIWLEILLKSGDRVLAHGGTMDDRGVVDPWSHFVNAFVLDRNGNRIDRRNAEDIFVALYNNQIPPGAADVAHYRFTLPKDITQPIDVVVRLKYRKFDTAIMSHVTGNPFYDNKLPIMLLAEDSITFPIDQPSAVEQSPIETWQRWNDYGIGLLRKGGQGQLRQAAEAFAKVEELGRPDGPLNLARVYLAEGLIQTEAPRALQRAADLGAYEWSLLWFGARVAAGNGDHAKATANLRDIVRGGFTQAEGRNFDFSKDYRLLNTLAESLYQIGLQQSGDTRRHTLTEVAEWYQRALAGDPENLTAHWGLYQVYRLLGDRSQAEYHQTQHARYKPDDTARGAAVSAARKRYPAANQAAEPSVIYDLDRKNTTDQEVKP